MTKNKNFILIILSVIFMCSLSSCNDKYPDNSSFCKNHNLYETINKVATCTNEGELIVKCKVCEYQELKAIEKKPHTEIIDEAVEATCTSVGWTEGSHCSVCNTIIISQKVIVAKPHNFVDATCLKPQYCQDCLLEVGTTISHNFENNFCTMCNQEVNNELLFELSEDKSYYIVSKLLDKTLTNLTIPSTYQNKPVKEIATHAITNAPFLQEIIILEGITVINEEAFLDLISLKKITIPKSVKKIQSLAFYSLDNLEDVYYNGTVDDWLRIDFVDKTSTPMYYAEHLYINNTLVKKIVSSKTINEIKWQLYGIKDLEKIIINSNPSSIQKGALKECSNLISLELPYLGSSIEDTSTNYLGYLFDANDYALHETVVPQSLKEVIITQATILSDYAFSNCIYIEKVVLPTTLQTIPKYVFQLTQSLTEIVLPNSLVKIDDYAFLYSNISKIVLPTTLQIIGIGSFLGVPIKEINLPNSLLEIGDYAFSECILTEIVIPNSVKTLGTYLFNYCLELKKVTLPNNLQTIPEGTFSYCLNLSQVNIPTSTISIAEYAFRCCKKLLYIYLHKNIQVIEQNAFYESNQLVVYLESKIIPNTFDSNWNQTIDMSIQLPIDKITYYLGVNNDNFVILNNCHYIIQNDNATLTKLIDDNTIISLEIPESIGYNNAEYKVNAIGDFALFNNPDTGSVYNKLEEIDIPSTIETIGEFAFLGCKFESFSFPTPCYINKMGRYAFGYCDFLKEFKMQKWGYKGNMTTIEEGTFYCNWMLQSITLPDTITTFEKNVFTSCGNVIKFDLPKNLERVTDSELVFFHNFPYNTYQNGLYIGSISNPYLILMSTIDNSISEFTIHNDTKIINKHAFINCNNLEKITLSEDLKCIDTESFYYLDKLREIIIPDTVIYLNENSFYDCNNLTIYCEALSKPDTYHDNFNGVSKVVFGYIIEYEIAFDSNGGSEVLPQKIIKNGKLTKPENPTKENYTFIYWALDNEEYSFDTPITQNITLIAKWGYTIEYVLDGGTLPSGAPTSFEENSAPTLHEPTKEGYTFLGWYEDSELVETLGNKNYVLKAKWEEGEIYSRGLEYQLNDDQNSYSVTGIGTCTDTKIIIPSKYNGLDVTSIGDSAFKKCTTLVSIILPRTISSIGDNAFYSCTSLSSITIPENMTEIGNFVFAWCRSITNIQIPNNITTIGNGAFFRCNSLTKLIIPKSISKIGESAFYNTYSSVNVYYEGTIEDWCNIIFSTSSSMTIFNQSSLYMKNTNNEYYEATNIEIPNTVTKIGDNQFSGFTNIKSITIPKSITIIGISAFEYCTGLTSIIIPKNITNIYNYAFRGCSSLTIYCEVSSKLDGWDEKWNISNCPVVWGYTS